MKCKHAVLAAVAGLLASAGFAKADGTDIQAPRLSLDPTALPVVTADDAAPPQGLLMQGLDKIGVGKPISDAGFNIYGWVEGGYTYNHRGGHRNVDLNSDGTISSSGIIFPGPFDHEYGNHFMLNQVDLRFERLVDPSKGKFDVGGLIETMYGSDAARIHSAGLGYSGSDSTDNNTPNDPLAVSNLWPTWQFDIPQAYIDVAIPVGNGLKIRAGKFVTELGYETIDPRGNPFYSHSYLFNFEPFTQTGIVGFYNINDQWAVSLGVSRGWDDATEDNNGAIDALGNIVWTPNKQWSIALNWTSGPEDNGDTSHYRTAIDPVITWQVTDAFKLGLEVLYVYDGGRNASSTSGITHAYGDTWGAALYAAYTINDYFTLNARLEKAHAYLGTFNGVDATVIDGGGIPTINVYDVTLGTTIHPFPKDPIGQNLSIRPEIRYQYSEDDIFTTKAGASETFKDQLTFGIDAIFTF